MHARSRALSSAVLLVGATVLVAGCLSSSDTGSQAVEPSAAPGIEPPVQLPEGTDEITSGAEGAVRESAGMAWLRKYWGDAKEIVLLEERGTIARVDPPGCVFPVFFFVPCGFFVTPAPGKLVPPGTAEVIVTVTYTPPPTAPTAIIRVSWMTAAGEAQEVEVPAGEPVVIKVGEKDADAPLQARSLWWFSVRPVAQPAGVIAPSDIAIKAVAKRAEGELPLIPEAKDPWGGAARIVLASGAGASTALMSADPAGEGFTFGQNVWGIETGLVAPGTSKIQAKLSWSNAGTAKPALKYWWDGDNNGPLTLVEDGASSRTFEFVVPEKLYDSPYQPRSLWAFWYSVDGGDAPAGVAGPGEVTLDAVAVKG